MFFMTSRYGVQGLLVLSGQQTSADQEHQIEVCVVIYCDLEEEGKFLGGFVTKMALQQYPIIKFNVSNNKPLKWSCITGDLIIVGQDVQFRLRRHLLEFFLEIIRVDAF